MKFKLVISALILWQSAAVAEPVYKNIDSQGRVIFSAGQGASGTKAELPEITKESIDSNIAQVKRETPETCEKRGGVDCEKGPDSGDGSAICLDGTTEVALHFTEVCSEAKLEIVGERFLDTDGLELKGELLRPSEYGGVTPDKVVVSVRNLSSVSAKEVQIQGQITKRKLPGRGPQIIEGHGLEDYEIEISIDELPPYSDFRKNYRTLLGCTNCRGVKRSSR